MKTKILFYLETFINSNKKYYLLDVFFMNMEIFIQAEYSITRLWILLYLYISVPRNFCDPILFIAAK